MATVSQIRQWLADALTAAAVPGNIHAVYPGVISGPALVCRRLNTDYGIDFDGSDDGKYAVTIYVPATHTENAQDLMDAYLSTSGASSVKAALEAAADADAINDVVTYLNVEGVEEEGVTDVASTTYLIATVTVTVGSR